MKKRILISLMLLLISNLVMAQKQEPMLMLPNGINMEGYSWLGEDLRINADGSLIFTQGRKEGKCIVWDAKTRNKLKEFKSLKSVMFQKNNFIGIINAHEEIDSLFEIIVYKTDDLTNVQHHEISIEEIGMMKVKDIEEIEEIFISNKIVLRDSFNFKIINLLTGEKEIIRTNLLADEKVHLFAISNDIFFCGKNKVHCFNEISKEVKDLYALKEDDKYKELNDFVVDSINSRLYFEEISSDKEGNTLSIELKVINLKNVNILNNKLNFSVDLAKNLGINEGGIYYETSYSSKENVSYGNGGIDEYFAKNKDNHKVFFWDINQNEIITLVDSTGGNQSDDSKAFLIINSMLYRISDNLIEIINFDKTVVKIDLDSNTIIKTSSRADNHNMIVLYSRKSIISKGITSKLENNAKDSTNLIIFCKKGIKLFTLKELSSFSILINNDSTVVVENYNNGDIYPKWNILNINTNDFKKNFEFLGTSYSLSNSTEGYKFSEDHKSLKSMNPFFEGIQLSLTGINFKKHLTLNNIFILNTSDEVTNYEEELVDDSIIIVRDSHDKIIYDLTIDNNFKGVKISKSKRFLIFEHSIIDLKTKNTLFLKNAIPCIQILKYSEIGSKVLEDTVNNLLYSIEQIPRKKRKQKYIYFNLKELSVDKIIHSFRIKNTYIDTETAKDWRENYTLSQDFNVDFKNNRIYLNEGRENDFFSSYNFKSPDPLWSIKGFEFFKLDSDGNILAKKEHGMNNSEFYKVNAYTGEILFKREFNEINDFVTFLDDPKNNQILIYQNLGSIISLNRITGEVNKDYKIEGVARNKSSNKSLVKFLLSNDLLITDGLDESTQIRRASDGKLLYSFYDIPTLNTNKESADRYVNNRLFFDPNYRFDGSPGAIEKLYFVCGLEVVELNQVKDSLYVPNLVQRIMNGENLDHLPKLSDLNICGVTPIVEPIEKGNKGYHYEITPRTGGVGDIEIYLNGVVRQTESAKRLKLKNGKYSIQVDPKLIERYQVPGEALQVKVIAKTANNSISSRSVILNLTSEEPTSLRKPSLHAVMIGVDDYKDDNLDLNYAAKDANDLHQALEQASKKFFNVDDTNRVFFYNLTRNREGKIGTDKIKGKTPDKANIIQTLEEIEKKSKPEDILLVFFAGHGEIVDKDQLLLLTTEATSANFEGIRMRELLEQLNKIPAGKRVLILDACHSGAAINNMDMAQLTGKRDVKDAERQSQRLKELDKLASKSGFAIITASSSDQKALELPQYEHGLMTYALLNAMLNNKSSLDENNQLQLDKWLIATEEEVKKLNQNQSAERMVPVTFTLGKIDEEVRSSIVLKEIPTVFVDNVLNKNTFNDNLKIKYMLSSAFQEMSRGSDSQIMVADFPNAVKVNILYEEKGDELKANISLYKENFEQKFELTGKKANISAFVQELMNQIRTKIQK